ncbi:MAG: hypothetical protein QM742_07975 [Aquabacterium sp.]
MSMLSRLFGPRLAAMLLSPRAWAMFATLASRGSGFVASFSLSRLAGAPSLALYISTVITAAAVATPVAQVLFNSTTLSGTAAPDADWLRRFLRVNLWMATVLLVPICVLFYLMHWDAAASLADGLALSHGWLVAVGISTVAGQIYLSVLTGVLNGMGAQVASARLMAVVAMALMVLSYPAVSVAGVRGAWSLLLLSNWVPVLWQGWLFSRHVRHRWARQVAQDDVCSQSPAQAAWHQFRAGLPSVLGLVLTGFAGWFCTIYLVQQHLGAHAVAVVAVSNQWITLMLLPATSWGGVILRELAHQRLTDPAEPAVWRLLRRMLGRNGAVTLLVVGAVLLISPWIEKGYRLEGHSLVALLCVGGAAAMLSAMSGVFERLMVCWERQAYWLVLLVVGLLAQLAFTVAWIDRSVVSVQAGALLAAALTFVLGAWLAHRVLGRQVGGTLL